MQNECIFCKIVSGDIPSSQVYADDKVVAFLDLAPAAVGHTLVIPRAHYATLFDVPFELAPALLAASQRVGRALMEELGAEGINVWQNNHAAAGQMVFHAHWHVVPRYTGDGLALWKQGSYDSPEAMQAMAKRLWNRVHG